MIPDAVRAGPTWVVATDAAAERWTHALREKGLQRVVPLRWGTAHPLVDRAEVLACVQRHAPDLVLLTSQEALTCLGEAPVPSGWKAVCVGMSTLEQAVARGFGVETFFGNPLGGSRFAEQLLATPPLPRRVLWMRGREARTEAAQLLRGGGVEVIELVTYGVDERPTFAGLVAEAPDPAAVVVGSPRGAAALAGALERSNRRFAGSVSLITLGDTTAQSLQTVGLGSYPRLNLYDTFGPIGLGLPSSE